MSVTGPGVIVDVGAGGALVETDVRLAQREEVELVVERQPGLLEYGLEVRGVVAWSGEDLASPQRGFGVAFTTSAPNAVERLRRFVLALLRKRLPESG